MPSLRLLQGRRLSSTAEVTMLLLKALKVQVTATTVQNAVDEHPHSASLYAISDSLKRWRVENICLQLESNQLHELPVPFLAHLHVDAGSFVVVTQVTKQKVTYLRNANRKTEKSIAAFAREWSGVALLAEAGKNAGENDFAVRRRKQWLSDSRMPAILIGFLILIGLSFYSGIQTQGLAALLPATLATLKLAGCVITGLLLWYEIDNANPALRQICSSGKQTDCNAVLGSKASKIFKGVSWSEVGFVYFAGGCLFLLFSAHAPFAAFGVLAWLNLWALPYVAFSVFYQWKVVKQWCPLCLVVQGLLLSETFLNLIGYKNFTNLFHTSYSTLVLALTAFSLPVFVWLFAKPVLLKAQQATKFQREAAWLKYNPQLFPALLSTQKPVSKSPEGLGITIGNPAAANTIIKVCNPYCGPCAKAHREIDELLENRDIKVQIIFAAMNSEGDIRAKPVKHFLSLYETKNEPLLLQALDDWYITGSKDYDLFAQKYPLNDDLNRQGEKLDAMIEWCKKTEIAYTPTFFINGFELPKWYKVEDIKYLL